jgi:DNA-binding transcriptional ArsR family regulator
MRKTSEAWQGFDGMVHEPARLVILEALYQQELNFSEIREYIINKHGLLLTDGNLASHLLKLEKARYISADRHYEGRKPTTRYTISDDGKKAFEEYLNGTSEVIKMALKLITKPAQ